MASVQPQQPHAAPFRFAPAVRSFREPLLLSTAPHYLALGVVLPCAFSSEGCIPGPLCFGYAGVILFSSSLSLAWHRSKESEGGSGWLLWLDYAFALLWAIYDAILASRISPTALAVVMLLNALCLLTNKVADWAAQTRFASYEVLHSAWHVLSVCKSIAVAYIVSNTSQLGHTAQAG